MCVRNVDLDSDNEYIDIQSPSRQRQYYPLLPIQWSKYLPSGKYPPGKYPPLTSHISISSDEDDIVTQPIKRRHHFKFKFINCCFQGNIKKRVNLTSLKSQWKGSILKTTDPVMLIHKNGQNTLLMFSTGKFRFMGPFHPTAINAKKQLVKVSNIPKIIKNASLTIQTCTVTFKLPGKGVHLPRLAAALRRDNYEITFNKHEFPAIAMYRWAPMHVNIFYSGNVVVIGSKGIVSHVRRIYNFLVQYINANACWDEYLGKRWMRN